MNSKITNELQQLNAKILLSLSNDVYSVPDSYFEFQKEKLTALSSLKRDIFEVDVEYFQHKKNSLKAIAQEAAEPKQKARVLNLRAIYSAAAVMIALVTFIFILKPQKEATSFNEYLSQSGDYSEFDIAVMTQSTREYFLTSFDFTDVEEELDTEEDNNMLDQFYTDLEMSYLPNQEFE